MKKALIIIPLALSLGFLAGCGGKDKVTVKEVEKEEPVIEEQEDAAEETPKTKEKEEPKEKAKDEEKEDNSAEDTKTVELEGASFQVPTEFVKTDAGQDVGLPYVLFSIDGISSINLVVEDISAYPDTTLKEYMDITIATTGYDYESVEYYELNGMEANEAISFMNEGWKLQQTTILHNGKAYIFTYGNTPEKFDEQLPLIKDILNTVSFND